MYLKVRFNVAPAPILFESMSQIGRTARTLMSQGSNRWRVTSTDPSSSAFAVKSTTAREWSNRAGSALPVLLIRATLVLYEGELDRGAGAKIAYAAPPLENSVSFTGAPTRKSASASPFRSPAPATGPAWSLVSAPTYLTWAASGPVVPGLKGVAAPRTK